MKRNTFLITVGSAVILSLIAGGIYLGLTYHQSIADRNNSIKVGLPYSPSNGVTIRETIPLPVFSSSSPAEIPVGWKTYRLDEYKFQISYLADWLLTNNVWEPFLAFAGNDAYPTLKSIDIYSERGEKDDQEAVGMTIAVYAKPLSIPLSQWLFTAFPSLSKAEKGNIDRALTKAYSGDTGILTYNESKEGEVAISELGAVAIYSVPHVQDQKSP